MSKETLSSVWLVPAEKDIPLFQNVIDDLAGRHQAESFIPHITIWGAVTAPFEVVEKATRDAVKGIEPFDIEIEEIDYSEQWAKTLFAQLRMNVNLEEINNRLGNQLAQFTPYQLNPHLSLIYKKEMTEDEKLEEIPNIHLPETFKVDTIAIVVPQDPIAKWENVAAWQIPFRQTF